MPDNAEMIRVLAEKCMGWRRRDTEIATYYDDGDGHELGRTRLSIGQRSGDVAGWDPFTSWGDAGMLLDKMRLSEDFDHFDHFREALRAQAKDAGWHPGRAFEWWFAECSNRPEAIAMAAYRAVTEGKDGQ